MEMRDGDNNTPATEFIPGRWPPLRDPVTGHRLRNSRMVYLIGSLRNESIPLLGNSLRRRLGDGWTVFDDWYCAGPEADDYWRTYEIAKGHDFAQGVRGKAAQNVLAFDKSNLESCTHAVLVLPAGRSGHLELGYTVGLGKKTFILLDGDYDRWDVMYGFADLLVTSTDELVKGLQA